jgi:hypothetical protein
MSNKKRKRSIEPNIQSHHLIPDAVLPIPFRSQHLMMRPDAKVEKVYLYPKAVDFRKFIDGVAALVELEIKVAVFHPVLFVFLNKPRNRVKILYLPSAKATRVRALQNIAGLFG